MGRWLTIDREQLMFTAHVAGALTNVRSVQNQIDRVNDLKVSRNTIFHLYIFFSDEKVDIFD